MRKDELQRPWLKWVLVFFCWSLVAVFIAARNIVSAVSLGQPILWSRVVLGEIIYWEFWALMTPVIFWFAARFPIDRGHWPAKAARIVLFGLLIAPLQIVLEVAVNMSLAYYLFQVPAEQLMERLAGIKRIILIESFTGVLIYLVIIAGYYSYDYYKKYRARDIRATQLEGILAQAELQNLKMQLHPHFLFNTLHTISVTMNKDTESANEMLIRLSDLLRMSLENVGTQEVSLKEELEFLSGYLEIEQIRFRDRLEVSIDVDPEILDASVPSFILQPLVENAVRHGTSPLLHSGKIEIRGYRENAMIRLEINDNGVGIKENGNGIINIKEGIGISNTRARLVQLYGEEHDFQINNLPSGGVSASILLPFREVKHDDVRNEN